MRKLLTIAATALVLLAGLAAVSCGGDDDQATPTPGNTLAVLQEVGAGLPRDPALTADEEYIYTGGESTESVYWTKDPAQQVIHFYWERLPPAGWDVGTLPTWTTQPTSDKDPDVHQTAVLTATRGGFRVTVTAQDNIQKDPARGTVRVSIAIERTEPSATPPPILPSPSGAEGF